jgi:hypothetical protein
MKFNLKFPFVVAAMAAIVVSGSASASSLVNLQLLAKPSGSGSYSSSLSGIAPGTTLDFEVVGQYAAAGTTNSNTAKVPNGSLDSINSLPIFALQDTDGGQFLSSSLNSTFAQGTGASAGTGLNSNTLSGVRVIGANGVFTNADAQLVFLTGTFITGSSTSGISFLRDTTSSGSLKIAGTGATSIVGINTATETSADPLVSHASLALPADVSPVPAPTVMSAFGLAGVGVLGGVVRRRRNMLA